MVFLIKVITPGAPGKFLGSSVDFASIEVHLNRSLTVDNADFSPFGKCRFFFPWDCLGEGGDDGNRVEEEGRLLVLPGRRSLLLLAGDLSDPSPPYSALLLLPFGKLQVLFLFFISSLFQCGGSW